MLDRKIDRYIRDYYESNRTALLIAGARQIGKTYSIREFGKTFESFIEINFVENPDAVALFANAKDSRDILLRLSTVTDKPLIKGKTLSFLMRFRNARRLSQLSSFLLTKAPTDTS